MDIRGIVVSLLLKGHGLGAPLFMCKRVSDVQVSFFLKSYTDNASTRDGARHFFYLRKILYLWNAFIRHNKLMLVIVSGSLLEKSPRPFFVSFCFCINNYYIWAIS